MALLELMQEESIDKVTVQQVLDRASVGRSTFYLHFRDKNDLLLSQLEKFLEIMSKVLSVRKGRVESSSSGRRDVCTHRRAEKDIPCAG
jgi:AcrR family transcriptional regulator